MCVCVSVSVSVSVCVCERPTGRAALYLQQERVAMRAWLAICLCFFKRQGQLPPKVSKMLAEQGPIEARSTCL